MQRTDNTHPIYIGIMSGTSLDGLDIAAISINPSNNRTRFIAAQGFELPSLLRSNILSLTQAGNNEIEKLGRLDVALGHLFADSVNNFIAEHNLPRALIHGIGSHGQTIRHRPEAGFTLQIGDANIIAEKTAVTTVADFRRRDMACEGQGAPLVPAFHDDIFRETGKDRVIINIGGMSNITILSESKLPKLLGFDTGPGNVLLDAWIQKNKGVEYDKDGQWAASGTCQPNLLNAMMGCEFFHTAPPKSTGREDFNIEWLDNILTRYNHVNDADVQATLLELTALTITKEVERIALTTPELYVCGGGARNQTLMQRLQALNPDSELATTHTLGLHPDWVEASAFAWLAYRTLTNQSGNSPAVTGAKKSTILGAIYPA